MIRRAAPSLTALAVLAAAPTLAGCGSATKATTAPTHAPASPTSAAPAPSATPSTSPAAAPAAACTTDHLKAAVTRRGAAAGSTYFTLTLTNVGSAACTLGGYGGLSLVDSSGAQLGAPAKRDTSAGKPATLTLKPGAVAGAKVQLAEATNYDQSACGFKPAVALRVYPPNETHSVLVQFFGDGCTKKGVVLMSEQPYTLLG